MVATVEVVRHNAHADHGVVAMPASSIGGATKPVWYVTVAAFDARFSDSGPRRDGLYRVVAETRSTVGQATYAVQSGYDSVGNRTQVTYPGTGRQVTSFYDRAHRLIQVKDVSGTVTQNTTSTYDVDGNTSRHDRKRELLNLIEKLKPCRRALEIRI
jgi:YD repeat-containing protein